MLTILDRYVLKQVALPLISTLGIGLLLMLSERLVRLLDTTLGKRNSFGAVFELLAYLVPHYLGTAVPAALFLGLLFGFNKLSKNQELDAMLSAGVGLHRLVRPMMMLAAIFSVVSIFIYGFIQPYTRYAYRSVLFDVKNVEAFYLAEEGVFMQAGSRTFILDKLDRSTNSFERIFLFDYEGPNGSETLTARDGVLIPVPGQERPILRLTKGHRLRVERWPTLAAKDTVVPSIVAQFETTDTPLGRVRKDLFRPRGDDERELTLPEIYAQMDNPPAGATVNSMKAEFHRRIVNIIAMLILPILALPFAVGRPRSPRAYRLAAAMVLLVAFHEILAQGAVATKSSGLSPLFTLWLPIALLSGFALWRFYSISFKVADDGFDTLLSPVQDFFARIWTRIRNFRKLSA